MDTRTPEYLPRQLRGAAPQAGPAPVLRDLGTQARPSVGGEAEQGGARSLSPAVEWFEERAAVIEFEAGKSRVHAESMALQEVVAHLGQEAGRKAYAHMNARRASA